MPQKVRPNVSFEAAPGAFFESSSQFNSANFAKKSGYMASTLYSMISSHHQVGALTWSISRKGRFAICLVGSSDEKYALLILRYSSPVAIV